MDVGSDGYCMRPCLSIVSFPSMVRMTCEWWDVILVISACCSRALVCRMLSVLVWSRLDGGEAFGMMIESCCVIRVSAIESNLSLYQMWFLDAVCFSVKMLSTRMQTLSPGSSW